MNPEQAVNILNQATQPANIGRLTRQDFVNIETALQSLAKMVQDKKAEEEKANPPLPFLPDAKS